MSRQLNLAKVAGKNMKITKPVEKSVLARSVTNSPYFSPIAGRTRNSAKHTQSTANEKKPQSSETKFSSESELGNKIGKKLISKPGDSTSRKHIKIEYDEKTKLELNKELNEEPVKQAKKRSSHEENVKEIKIEPKIKIKKDASDDSTSSEKQVKWEPKNWRKLLANIREMRKEKTAPVDTMGCDKCHDEQSDKKTIRFHQLVALMLSSQTKDAITFECMERLKLHGLTPEKMVKTSTNDLEQLLYPVGFYRTKAKNIQKTSQILIDKFDSDIPNDIKGLLSLPGVGPKMANICMRVAWNIVSGIGVDTHVHRIANRLKWMPKETKDPEQTRVALEKWLPFENWSDVNKLLVGFGQTICTPINPKCSECLNAMICPASTVKKN